MAPKSADPKAPGTPGRHGKASRANQFFDVGKVGRKTGIVLKDTGKRDEHGLEPIFGIFSSPDVVENMPGRYGGSNTREEGSGSMDVEEESAPSVDTTLRLRKTPRFPPPRATPQRKSGIGGSPKRMSTGPASRHQSLPLEESEPDSIARVESQPPPNRILEFGRSTANAAINSLSPFRPRKTLRRSAGPARRDPFSLPDEPGESEESEPPEEHGGDDTEDSIPAQVQQDPSVIDQDRDQDRDQDEVQYEDEPEAEPVDEYEPGLVEEEPLFVEEDTYENPQQQLENEAARAVQTALSSPEGNAHLRNRTPVGRTDISQASESPQSRKRNRDSLHNDENSTYVDEDRSARKRGRPSSNGTALIHHENGDVENVAASQIAAGDEYEAPLDLEQDYEPQTESHADSVAEPELEPEPEPEIRSKKSSKEKVRKGASKQKTTKAERTASKVNPSGSPVRQNGSPSKVRSDRGASVGPVSNVNLRASTPFEDAGVRVSRSGRPVVQPLQYWRNESYIWKHGEIEGIIRAEQVEKVKPKQKGGRKKGTAAKKKQAVSVNGVEEDSDVESVMPDDWEEEVGVIAGAVAQWDPETSSGNPDQPIQEDIAFSSSSIVTREVANSAFTYAKIMTLPFFGSGVVELPPLGYKRAKNSRRMQMVFFVHQGKVVVQVGGAAGGQGAGKQALGEEFAISKGGVWVVPRG
ncbi:hypothetical protein K431DRAFT_350045, partial [Polychaeton citri CBS 116435]